MIDMLLFEPHVIAMQEHQNLLLTSRAFRNIANIPGYTLIMRSRGRKTEGRPSGGLAIWIHNSILRTYNIQKNLTHHVCNNSP